jgi:hypothetical protein
MNDSFEKKVRAAAAAAWWVVLVGYALLLVTWVVYLALINDRPVWMLRMWGGDLVNQGRSWESIQTVSLWFMGVFKLFLWFLFLAALWLTLWAKQLRKAGGEGAN